jgi:hypothetical protein
MQMKPGQGAACGSIGDMAGIGLGACPSRLSTLTSQLPACFIYTRVCACVRVRVCVCVCVCVCNSQLRACCVTESCNNGRLQTTASCDVRLVLVWPSSLFF